MKLEFDSALAEVRTSVSRVIAEDPFPDQVEPELLREAVRTYPMRGGKRIRPALLLWSCGAVGADPAIAMNAAAAVEIFHNWTLVHDDIIDRDDFRRGQPTCHIVLASGAAEKFSLNKKRAAEYGTDMAILAGDVQQAWAGDMLLRTPVSAKTLLAASRRMHEFLNRELISGEALDIEFEYRPSLPEKSEIRKMIAGKTGVLLAYCTETGAMIGLDTDDVHHPFVQALSRYAKDLGHAFQLQDDLLGLYGNERSFGKPIGSDFRERKPTILYSQALESLSPAGKAELNALTGLESYGEAQISALRKLMDECGAHQAVSEEMERSTKAALDSLETLPDSPYRTLLETLAKRLCGRRV